MQYTIIYDGQCNLCTSLVKVLAQIDRGQLFTYVSMQNETSLGQWEISACDCELGMILIDNARPETRWQGSAAAEEIARLLPAGDPLINVYRGIPGLKALGDRLYGQIRDHRYEWFGRRDGTYHAENQ
jgi:predicted DCC family thiol-disulfide oxidoreductase YuxK